MSKSGLKTKSFTSDSPQATWDLGKTLLSFLPPNTCLVLEGDLGAGKTQLCKGLIHALTEEAIGEIKSPTFSYLRSYQKGKTLVNHFDLYRLNDPTELEELGLIEELHDENSFRLVEWPEKAGPLLPKNIVCCHIELIDAETRRFSFTGDFIQ